MLGDAQAAAPRSLQMVVAWGKWARLWKVLWTVWEADLARLVRALDLCSSYVRVSFVDRHILHLDIDAFLASVEQLRDPAVLGKPVAVGTGVVASRSYEAKRLGVETAMPLHEAVRRCPELIVREGDSRLVERYRQKVAEVIRRFSPVVEICSLDDFYADLTGVPLMVEQVLQDPSCVVSERSLTGLCRELRKQVRKETGLSIAQGLGSTRTVARLATTKAKPGGICEVPHGCERDFLADFSIDLVPGIGPKSQQLLRKVGIESVRQLWTVDRELLRQSFGVRGDDIWLRCRGLDDAPVKETPTLRSISRETSFEPRTDVASQQRSFLRGMLAYLLDRATTELRQQRLLARTVQVRLRHVDGVHGERSRSIREATDRTDLCMEMAGALLDELLTRRVLVRLVGVTLTSLEPHGTRQGQLFGEEDTSRQKLFAAVDAVRKRHGFGALVIGAASDLLGQVPHGPHGFRLRTPSLTK
ncbi:MAG TPA: DNA polymerase IV [Planctomycetes bacterium]|nr:DNA polymerase IV [Planctomycetota bacterium]